MRYIVVRIRRSIAFHTMGNYMHNLLLHKYCYFDRDTVLLICKKCRLPFVTQVVPNLS